MKQRTTGHGLHLRDSIAIVPRSTTQDFLYSILYFTDDNSVPYYAIRGRPLVTRYERVERRGENEWNMVVLARLLAYTLARLLFRSENYGKLTTLVDKFTSTPKPVNCLHDIYENQNVYQGT